MPIMTILVGTIGAMANGSCMPIGANQNNTHIILSVVSKVGKFVQLLSTFIGGLIIAFIKMPLLTIVMLSCVPLLVAVGGSISFIITKAEFHGQHAYAKAGNVVAFFTGEKQAITSYNKYLVGAYKSAVHEGSTAGIDDNFLKWRYQLESVLDGYDLFGHFDGSNIAPPKFTILDEEGVTFELTATYKD
ncbi:unnamed protein product [Prunus brigantina]